MTAFRTFLLSSLFFCLFAFAENSTNALFSIPNENGSGVHLHTGQFPLPATISQDDVRVRMLRCQICQSDRRVIRGTKNSVLDKSKLVLGHEGIGVVDELPQGYSGPLKRGQLVVALPHVVDAKDPFEIAGTPNLSPDMKHLGFHLNGVFADKMDFDSSSVLPIEGGKEIYKGRESEYLDQMVKIEPLACVIRGVRMLREKNPEPLSGKRALVLGGGPMGLLNALYLKSVYPHMQIDVYDNDPVRQKLAQNIPEMKGSVLTSPPKDGIYDLVITATSDKKANVEDALNASREGGTVLLFSGINMKTGDERPIVNGVDLETVHRKEGVSEIRNYGPTKKNIKLVGTSGYVKDDIKVSIGALHADLENRKNGESGRYGGVTTTAIPHLESTEARSMGGERAPERFAKPALQHFLETDAHDHLKILNRNSDLIEPGSLFELSDYLAKAQKVLKEKHGIDKIYIGGGSARAVLDHIRYKEPLNMRDLDIFAIRNGKVEKALLEDISKDFEKTGLGQTLMSELQPRNRANPEIPGKEGQKYTIGYGFTMQNEGPSLDFSVYNHEKEFKLNGLLDIDTVLLPISASENLVDYAHKISALNDKDLVKSGFLIDPHEGYKTWRDKGTPKIINWPDIEANPLTHAIRVVRGMNKTGESSLAPEVIERLRPAIEKADGSEVRRVIRNILKMLGDEGAVHELRELERVGLIKKWSPELARLLENKTDAEIKKLFEAAIPVPEAKTSELGLGRFKELIFALDKNERAGILNELSLVEPNSANAIRKGKIGFYSGAFDPVHLGHLDVAEQAAKRAGLEKIVIYPAINPKDKANASPFDTRYLLLQKAVEGDLRYILPPKDVLLEKLNGKGGIDSLMDWVRENHGSEVVQIMGDDAFNRLVSRENAKETFKAKPHQLVVVERTETNPVTVPEWLKGKVTVIPDKEVSVHGSSSTKFRQNPNENLFMLPQAVQAEIQKRGLYGVDCAFKKVANQ